MTKLASQSTDLSYLQMMCDGDTEMQKTMIEMLLVELPQEIELMQSMAKHQDWRELAEVSHKMKSTLTYIGNANMTATNKEIEHLCKTSFDEFRIYEMLAALQADMKKVMEDLRSELAK
jgi:HPt (histidine-containing phosphotransfer) domain-containing protein